MATTAETYGFGARAPYATPRASEHDMKEKARLSGLFPRVRNEPMSKQLQVLLKEFEQNAALTGILERRRRLEERMQYELQGREGMDAVNRNLGPSFRTGMVGAATSAKVAAAIAGVARKPPPAPDAASVMTGGGVGQSGEGGAAAAVRRARPKLRRPKRRACREVEAQVSRATRIGLRDSGWSMALKKKTVPLLLKTQAWSWTTARLRHS